MYWHLRGEKYSFVPQLRQSPSYSPSHPLTVEVSSFSWIEAKKTLKSQAGKSLGVKFQCLAPQQSPINMTEQVPEKFCSIHESQAWTRSELNFRTISFKLSALLDCSKWCFKNFHKVFFFFYKFKMELNVTDKKASGTTESESCLPPSYL